jgi:serpin B
MADTLHFTLPPEKLHPAFNALDLSIKTAGAGGTIKGRNSAGDEVDRQLFQLHIANSLWGQDGYTFQPAFLDLLAQQYGAGMRLVDYRHHPNGARREINAWVSRETQKHIQDLIPSGALDELARLTLVNAIYFKADWRQPFDLTKTDNLPFYLLDGGIVQARGMKYEKPPQLPYLAGNGFQAVSLPYQGDRVAMLVIVPDAGQFTNFEADLGGDQVLSIQKALEPTTVNLVFPKFEFSSDYELAKTLEQLGMSLAFVPEQADFSGMDGTRNLYIQQVFHKAFVAVDEEGTEAAAATGSVFRDIIGRLPGKVELIVNRPFLFFIYDQLTGTLLFAGRVVDPEK